MAKDRRQASLAGQFDPLTKDKAASGKGIRLTAKNDAQQAVMNAIDQFDIIVIVGPAGTGKTHVGVAKGIEAQINGDVDNVWMLRPLVEAGESIGFLPGDKEEKISPHMGAFHDVLGQIQADNPHHRTKIGSVPKYENIGFIRGRTMNRSVIILDEAQNCTYIQLKLAMTRIGEGSKVIICGDPSQSDLKPGTSGLEQIAKLLKEHEGRLPNIAVVYMHAKDAVRHPVLAQLLPVLEEFDLKLATITHQQSTPRVEAPKPA